MVAVKYKKILIIHIHALTTTEKQNINLKKKSINITQRTTHLLPANGGFSDKQDAYDLDV